MKIGKVRSRRAFFATLGAAVAGAALPKPAAAKMVGVQRMAGKSRADFYAALLREGAMSPNEVRRINRLQLISVGPVSRPT
jgi:hypothetical protein